MNLLKTKCSLKGLKQIVKKGQGAYYSSGSRPSQTGHSGELRDHKCYNWRECVHRLSCIKEHCKKNSLH